MKLNRTILIANIICVLAGCVSHGDSAISDQPNRDGKHEEHEALNGESSENAPDDDALVEMNASADLSAPEADSCQPLNFPLTAFLTAAFNERAPVEESATWSQGGRCLHEQLLVAPADAFGTLAHNVLCQGGDDPQLCGTVAKRGCEVELLMDWAAARSEPVVARSPAYGFVFEVPPQRRAARMALYRKAQIEVDTLLDDAETVTRALDAGTRDCPSEDRAEVVAAHRKYTELSDELDQILSEDPAGER